jgi:hypothetical protein
VSTVQELRERLDRWTSAGLLDATQADAIVRFESEHPESGPVTTASSDLAAHGAAPRQVLPAEAIGYVGAALAFGAIAWMLGEVWVDITTGGQLAIVGLLTLLLFGGGTVLARTTSAPLQRLTSVLFLGGLAGAGWIAAIIVGEVLELSAKVGAVAVAATLVVLAVPLYLLRPRALPQVAALGSLVALSVTLLLLPQLTPDLWVFGLVIWAFGVAWLLLSLGGFLPPTAVSGVLGGILALIGPRVAGVAFESSTWWLGLGVFTAATLVGLALWRDTLHHLVVGAIGLFVLVPMLAFELFGDTIGAPATLLVIGLLLVALAVGLGRAGREIRGSRRTGDRPGTPRFARR